jgi:hypothetical protein
MRANLQSCGRAERIAIKESHLHPPRTSTVRRKRTISEWMPNFPKVCLRRISIRFV